MFTIEFFAIEFSDTLSCFVWFRLHITYICILYMYCTHGLSPRAKFVIHYEYRPRALIRNKTKWGIWKFIQIPLASKNHIIRLIFNRNHVSSFLMIPIFTDYSKVKFHINVFFYLAYIVIYFSRYTKNIRDGVPRR